MWILWAYFQVYFLAPVATIIQILIVIGTSLLFQSGDYPHQANVYDGESFDFVIIGGGTAGCVIANRLTEVKNWTVLLIEAGDNPPYISEIPGISVLLGASFPDWTYYTQNEDSKARRVRYNKGKMLGGSSSLNYMYYVRGNQADYTNWTASGNIGWDWDNVLGYFRKSEHFYNQYGSTNESRFLHGRLGYLGVTGPLWAKETDKYFEAFSEIGHNILADINGFEQLGYASPSYTIANQRRQSTALSFIKPIKHRKNLFVLKNTLVRKLIIDGLKVIGVEINGSNGAKKIIRATKEIVVSAGAINSPQLLMLSGIGPREHLSEIGIKTLINVPNVGKNLQDHINVPIILTGDKSSSVYDNIKMLTNIYRFPASTIMGHVALDKSQSFPDYQITAIPFPKGTVLLTLLCTNVFKWDSDICLSITNSTYRETLFVLITLLHPKSRGRILLQTDNPEDYALIYPNYLSDTDDLDKFTRCIEDFTEVVNTTYFKQIDSEIVDLNVKQCNGMVFASKEYWKCYVLNLVSSQFHLAGTCAMGPKGVVDERLRVKSVKGLRVVDASVMPTIVSGNTGAPVIMIAEKASDFIKIDNAECE